MLISSVLDATLNTCLLLDFLINIYLDEHEQISYGCIRMYIGN